MVANCSVELVHNFLKLYIVSSFLKMPSATDKQFGIFQFSRAISIVLSFKNSSRARFSLFWNELFKTNQIKTFCRQLDTQVTQGPPLLVGNQVRLGLVTVYLKSCRSIPGVIKSQICRGDFFNTALWSTLKLCTIKLLNIKFRCNNNVYILIVNGATFSEVK